MSTRIHKGGESRYVLQNAVVNDYFSLPAGYRIRNIVAENPILPYNLQNVQTITPVAGTPAAGTFTIDGVVIASLASDTLASICARIASAFQPTSNNVTTSGLGWIGVATATVVYLYNVNTRKSLTTGVTTSVGSSGYTSLTSAVVVGGVNSLGGTPNFTFGNTIGVVPVQNFTVTAGSTLAGSINVDGVPVLIGAGQTPAQIAATIAAANLWGGTSNNWSASVAATNSAQVILTGVVAKSAVTAVTVSLGTATGATFSAVTVVNPGVLDTSLFSTAQAIPVAGQTVSDVSAGLASNKTWQAWTTPDKSVVTFTGTSSAPGTVVVNGQTINIATGQTPTQIVATIVATAYANQGYYYSGAAGVLTIWGTPNRVGTVFPQAVSISLASVTIATVNSTHDLNYYLNYGATTAALAPLAIGSTNLYVLLEKLF